jgi:Ca-activated chloride channel family protein
VSFQSPLWLIGLVVVPVLAALYVLRERRRVDFAARFGNPALLPNVVDRASVWRRWLPAAILLTALAAMIVGVARPHATISVPREEATLIVAVDVSKSMAADDVKPTRLDAARNAAYAFLRRLPAKFRVGVVSIGSQATVALPPTSDRTLAFDALAALRPGQGTALGDAIAVGIKLGQTQRSADGAVPPTAMLLISDGARDGGRTDPYVAAFKARSQHIPVYTILVGTPDGVVHQKIQGGFEQLIQVPARPLTLQLVAKDSGGEFFTALDDPKLAHVYQRLGSRRGHRKESREMTDAFAGGAGALLLTGGLLSLLWFRRVLP